jgi:hypothetical protein
MVTRPPRGYAQCRSAAFLRSWGDLDVVPSDGVVYETDEGWGFYTGPDFGCVHFKDAGRDDAASRVYTFRRWDCLEPQSGDTE